MIDAVTGVSPMSGPVGIRMPTMYLAKRGRPSGSVNGSPPPAPPLPAGGPDPGGLPAGGPEACPGLDPGAAGPTTSDTCKSACLGDDPAVAASGSPPEELKVGSVGPGFGRASRRQRSRFPASGPVPAAAAHPATGGRAMHATVLKGCA